MQSSNDGNYNNPMKDTTPSERTNMSGEILQPREYKYGAPRYGKETRSINATMKIWKRIN